MSAIIEFAEKLRNQVSVVTVIEAHVQLRQAGQNLKGLCPFHREKTPSFTVNPGKQMWHCFGCNQGGDVIKFVQLVERISWIDAVRYLADKFHIAMPAFRGDSQEHAGEADLREKLLAVNKLAQEYYAKTLAGAMDERDSEAGLYMQRRRLDASTSRRFGLGLSPTDWTQFVDRAAKAGFAAETVEKAGLALQSSRTQRHYDRFRGRLMFPICDAVGRPIAFGGRVFAANAGENEPKYVNTPESPLYHKGHVLYALHLAKDAILEKKQALLMEGYMDVIRAHQAGFTNCVASCGTALTEDQARVLRKYAREVVFVYDGDAAGQKAMLRGCEILLDAEFAIKVVELPDDHDPDSFLCEAGAEAFQALVTEARDFFSFFLEKAARVSDRNSTDGKVQITEYMLPLLKRTKNPIAQRDYARRLAEFIRVEESLIVRQLSSSNPRTIDKLREAVGNTNAPISASERMLLKLAVESPVARQTLVERLRPEWLQNTRIRKWFEFCACPPGDLELGWQVLLAHCEGEEEESFLRGLALDDREPVEDVDSAILHSIARLEFNHRRASNTLITQQIHEFFREGNDSDACWDLTRSIDASSPAMRDLGRQYFLKPAPREKN